MEQPYISLKKSYDSFRKIQSLTEKDDSWKPDQTLQN